MARSAAGVRHAGVPGPSPTTVSTPRARPSGMASIGDGASATAHVARFDFVLATRKTPCSPAAASAAASDTPWQPTSLNTASDGLASRGVRASSAGGSKNRAGSPRASASACTAGSSILRSTEKTPASDKVESPAPASVRSTRSESSPPRRRARSPPPERTVAGDTPACPRRRHPARRSPVPQVSRRTGTRSRTAPATRPPPPGDTVLRPAAGP